jgi:23S rRNA pseudouridine1911/1915/1917 synthase
MARLDQYVTAALPQLSRSSAEKLIEQGKVIVNGDIETKSGYKLRQKDIVSIDYSPADLPALPELELEVLYEDDDCAVINKPVGLLTHSKGVFNPEATVASWLSSRMKDMSGDRAGIVHRLDRATSGVMIVAKNPAALSWLQKQFSLRKVKKSYMAVVQGTLKESEALIDMPIERNPKKPQTFRVGSNGKSAVTVYKVIQTNDQFSLLELKPVTGRTHQLRVHLQQLGHPILGDRVYGGPAAERLYLHAASLEITLLNKERKVFKVPIPDIFNESVR